MRLSYFMDMAILSTLHQWDARLLKQLFQQGQRRRSLTQVARIVSRSGDGYLQIAFPVTAWLLVSPSASVYAAAMTLAFALERLTYLLLKNGLQRRRPQEIMPGFRALVVPPDRFSFPSGHTSAAFCLATITGIVFGGPFSILYGWAGCVALSESCSVHISRGIPWPVLPSVAPSHSSQQPNWAFSRAAACVSSTGFRPLGKATSAGPERWLTPSNNFRMSR